MQNQTANEFVEFGRLLMKGRGSIADSLAIAETEQRRVFPRVLSALKAAVAVGTTSDPNWAASVHDLDVMSDGFVESLRQDSVFDRMLEDGIRRAPLRRRLHVVTTAATAYIVGESAPKPVSRLSLDTVSIEPQKSTAIVVVSDEVTRNSGGNRLLGDELRKAVIAATDSQFLSSVLASAPSVVSGGATSALILADLEALLDSVTVTASSRLYWVMSAAIAKKLATKATADGTLAFPGITPLGGVLVGLPALVTDQLGNDTTLALIDAASLAGNTEVVVLDYSEHATLEIDDAPVGGASAIPTSLWQNNLSALRAERWFGYEAVREDGAALLTSVAY